MRTPVLVIVLAIALMGCTQQQPAQTAMATQTASPTALPTTAIAATPALATEHIFSISEEEFCGQLRMMKVVTGDWAWLLLKQSFASENRLFCLSSNIGNQSEFRCPFTSFDRNASDVPIIGYCKPVGQEKAKWECSSATSVSIETPAAPLNKLILADDGTVEGFERYRLENASFDANEKLTECTVRRNFDASQNGRVISHYCELFKDDDRSDLCYGWEAFYAKNASLCEGIGNQMEQDGCKKEVEYAIWYDTPFEVKPPLSECENESSQDEKDACHSDIAYERNDSEICKSITDQPFAHDCVSFIDDIYP
ncbi:MAG: hypothetical protein V1708_04310 [Candidatus Micrarchaeota archaeon]